MLYISYSQKQTKLLVSEYSDKIVWFLLNGSRFNESMLLTNNYPQGGKANN